MLVLLNKDKHILLVLPNKDKHMHTYVTNTHTHIHTQIWTHTHTDDFKATEFRGLNTYFSLCKEMSHMRDKFSIKLGL